MAHKQLIYLIFSKNNIIFENGSIVVAMAGEVLSAEESSDSRESKSRGRVDVEDLGVRPSAVDEAQVKLVLPPGNIIAVDCLTFIHILQELFGKYGPIYYKIWYLDTRLIFKLLQVSPITSKTFKDFTF